MTILSAIDLDDLRATAISLGQEPMTFDRAQLRQRQERRGILVRKWPEPSSRTLPALSAEASRSLVHAIGFLFWSR